MKDISFKEKQRRTLCGNALADFYGEEKGVEDSFEFQRIRKALWARNSKGLTSREKHIYCEVVINIADPTYSNALREFSNYDVA